MSISRRNFIVGASVSAGFAPIAARAAGHGPSTLMAEGGDIVFHPVSHASLVMETPAGVIYVDPVGAPDLYADLPPADLILVTHEHGDHYNAGLLAALSEIGAALIVNPAVNALLPGSLGDQAMSLANGQSHQAMGVSVEAIPAYNLTDGRLNYHPQGRDNGYVLGLGGRRIYVSGDTEDTPEMRALQDIDLAFVCMNLPFTMAAEQAASAVAEFAPGIVYPYHYRGRDGGTQDPAHFADLLAGLGATTEVRFGNWYG